MTEEMGGSMRAAPSFDKEPAILATAWAPNVDSRVTMLDKSKYSRLSYVCRILAEAPGFDVCLLNGSTGAATFYDDHILAGVLARRGRRVLLTTCYWEPGSRRLSAKSREDASGVDVLRARPRLSRAVRSMIKARDHPNIHYTVLSTVEQRQFEHLWGIPARRVHFIPYFATSTLRGGMPRPGRSGPTIFCGGNSLRDYRPVLAAAPSINAEIVIATRLPMPTRLAPNVRVVSVSQEEYEDLARGARIHVMALVHDSMRSAGHQTYLNAMALGQPVVALDAPGVADHIDNEKTGMIVPHEPEALAAAVNRLLADDGLRQTIGTNARAAVESRFTIASHLASSYRLAAEIAR